MKHESLQPRERSVGRGHRSVLRIALCALAIGGVVIGAGPIPSRAAPNLDPGVGQAGYQGRLCVTVAGSTQGVFPGETEGLCANVPPAGRTTPPVATIEATHFDLEAAVAAAKASSRLSLNAVAPSARRQYAPLTFRHRLGDASPMFMTALVKQESLSTVVFEFFTRELELYYTIELTGAHVVEVNQYLPDTFTALTDQPVVAQVPALEQIRIDFTSIKETSIASGKVFEDSFKSL